MNLVRSFSRRFLILTLFFMLIIFAASFFVKDKLPLYVFEIFSSIYIIFSLLMWIILRISLSNLINKSDNKAKPKIPEKISALEEKKEREDKEKRLFLHLLSVLQREGRLVDFFSEDLGIYEDDQIGAAVRSIHDTCKKGLDKYLSLKPIFDQNEGEEILVKEDFDPNVIKLIGNVTGDPPFKGILRHKGWQVKKLNLPTFSNSQDSSIITPAEVEL